MMRHCKFTIFLILCFVLTGCSNGKNISPATSAIQESTTTPLVVHEEETSSIEQNNSKNIEAVNDNKLNTQEEFQELLQSPDKTYTIENKKYKLKEHKGEFNVNYPFLKSTERDMTVVNSVILARVVDELYYEDAETTINIDLDYEIKYANDAFISILFTGFYNAPSAAHPNNITYTINFDLKHNKPLRLYDAVNLDDNILEKLNDAMKAQLETESVEAFQNLSDDEFFKQMYDKNEGFYIQNDKIYIRFSISIGAGYHEYIYFNI